MADQEEPPELGRLPDSSFLWRASLWGGAAIVALASAILITQTDIGSQRLQLVFGSEPSPSRVVTQADFVAQPDPDMQRRETARLEAQVRELAADRERLTARIATLEQNLSDVTGSLKRELAAAAARPVSLAPTVAAPMTAPPPRLEPIGKSDSKNDGKSASPEEAKQDTRAKPAETQTSQDSRDSEEDAKTAEARAAAAKAAATLPQIAATQPTAPQTAEPPVTETQVAAAQSSEPQVAPPLGEPIPLPPMPIAGELSRSGPSKEVGIDLGGARSLEIMQARWVAVKANFGPLLNGLRPLVARDTRPHMTPYRLIVGPLPNAAAAAQVCARFAASKVTCRTAKFAGAQLTVPQ